MLKFELKRLRDDSLLFKLIDNDYPILSEYQFELDDYVIYINTNSDDFGSTYISFDEDEIYITLNKNVPYTLIHKYGYPIVDRDDIYYDRILKMLEKINTKINAQ